MRLADRVELDHTRRKLAKLEPFHRETQHRPMPSEHVRELTLRSIRKRINQLTEEIKRFEASAGQAGTHAAGQPYPCATSRQ